MIKSSSILFSQKKIGNLTLRNRFVRSAAFEGMYKKDTTPSPDLENLMKTYAKGGTGLIITGVVNISTKTPAFPGGPIIATDEQAKSWKKTIQGVHDEGAKILMQINLFPNFGEHALIPSVIPGTTLPGASELTNSDIEYFIQEFGEAAKRATTISGTDGVQVHCAHGAITGIFMNPYLNRRTDKWGDPARFVTEIVKTIKSNITNDKILSLKINGSDFVRHGNTSEDIAQIVKALGNSVDLYEISAGHDQMHYSRSNLDTKIYKRELKRKKLSPYDIEKELDKAIKMYQNVPYYKNFNADFCRVIRSINPTVNISSVGGWRNFAEMENFVKEGSSDLISLCRPLIRDPYLIKKFKEGKISSSTCKNCGICNLQLGLLYCHQKADSNN